MRLQRVVFVLIGMMFLFVAYSPFSIPLLSLREGRVAGLESGELLKQAEAAKFNVLLTVD